MMADTGCEMCRALSDELRELTVLHKSLQRQFMAMKSRAENAETEAFKRESIKIMTQEESNALIAAATTQGPPETFTTT